jgi:hypothetical protein
MLTRAASAIWTNIGQFEVLYIAEKLQVLIVPPIYHDPR